MPAGGGAGKDAGAPRLKVRPCAKAPANKWAHVATGPAAEDVVTGEAGRARRSARAGPPREGTVQNVTCNGAANGAIDVTVLDGTPGFTFEWDNGMMTEDISGLVAGTYRLKITNGNGCSVWGSYTVEQSASLVAELEVIQPTAVEVGEIDLIVSGGVAPYTYTWANGETSEDLFNVTAGFYEVTVMDANGCDVITNTIVEEMSVAGIEDMDGIQTSVYPNPTTDVATVTWNSATVTNITIVNANGQVVQNAAVAMQNTYKVEDLNPGMYFINLTDAYKHLNTQKLIVR